MFLKIPDYIKKILTNPVYNENYELISKFKFNTVDILNEDTILYMGAFIDLISKRDLIDFFFLFLLFS